MESKKLYPKSPRPKKDRSYRRYRVDYKDMIMEGGGATSWTSYYSLKWWAYFCAWNNQYVLTYGGTVIFTDQWKKDDSNA